MPADPWPVSVPHCFSFESMVSGVGSGLIRSSPDAGPAKVRRRTTANVKPLSGSLVLTYDELETLETFVDTTLIGGSLPFSFSDQRGGTILARFTGEGDLLPWRRFAAGKVVVDLKLEILP